MDYVLITLPLPICMLLSETDGYSYAYYPMIVSLILFMISLTRVIFSATNYGYQEMQFQMLMLQMSLLWGYLMSHFPLHSALTKLQQQMLLV
jgi:hypothetical protein